LVVALRWLALVQRWEESCPAKLLEGKQRQRKEINKHLSKPLSVRISRRQSK
jgi:hypothetical protein